MTIPVNLHSQIGVELARRLGLQVNGNEGHDLAGLCIACKSSNAFRLHQQTGVGRCFSCQGKWSPFQVAETVLRDRERAKALLVEMGVFQPSVNGDGAKTSTDPVESIARQKGVSAESLRAFGAQVVSPQIIRLPAYGPDGKPCTTFSMTVQGGKGLFAKGKKAGLFFPHVEGKVRLPQPGEIWHLVEGPKDAAALHGLGMLACGLNTCRLAAKFVRLFTGVEVVLIPDRDRAGEEGGQFTARVLRGVAKSVRIAVLPAEFKESKGEDVRDVLRRPGGRDLVLQAIADAVLPDGWDAPLDENAAPPVASVEIPLPEGDPIKLMVSTAVGKPQRLIVATRGEVEHRDRIDTDSSVSRDRFVKKLAAKLAIDRYTLAPLIESHLTKLTREIDEKGPATSHQGKHDEQSQATSAAKMAAEWELFHTPAAEAYATFTHNEHKETWAVRSKTFKRYVAKRFFDQSGNAINSEALSAAINLVEAQALFEGEEHPMHVRVAGHEGAIYVDLCNQRWQAIQITAAGWRVVDEAPVRFRRSKGMLALPEPARGAHIDLLRDFLNVSDDTWPLVVSWLVATMCPRGPYPVLALFAEQGSGKSTAGRLLRDLIDPNSAHLRAEPKDGRDLMITANNSWCLCYDNLSHIPAWLSDALCRLSTGGGFATRELYTDQDEIIFDSQRPVLLTSIEEVATRSDLLDRCLIVLLSAIPEDKRRAEAELLAAFKVARPKILGALLDAVVVALQRLPSIKLPGLPRMADFALWATAAEAGFGWAPGTFQEAYARNRESANDVALECALISQPLLDLLEEKGEWSGKASELLIELDSRVTDQVKKEKAWPKNPRSLSGHLKRLSPNLRTMGWILDKDRTSKKRSWIISRLEKANGLPSSPSPEPSSEGVCKSTQTGADWFGTGPGDADDADDANPGEWNTDRY